MSSFQIQSLLVTPTIRLKQLILKTLNLLLKSSVKVHVSALYSSLLRTKVSYTLKFSSSAVVP